ncbi:MAG: flagellar assembly protein FliH [Spirochaetes bacterium]|nr:MAG: flagellar assembly protein FliH [Spirochaetota bacterium]
MAKNVFRSAEVKTLSDKVIIESPFMEAEEVEETPVMEEYTGPTADDLRREAELFKQQWEKEKEDMIASAKAKADEIIRDAEQKAFEEVKLKTDEAQIIRQEAEDEALRIRTEARNEADALKEKTLSELDEIRSKAESEGFEKGREEGFEVGKQEVERLIKQLHGMLDKIIEKRNEIIDETETQLINLVLMIAKKVIKVISENQKNVVINNVIQALRKLKSRGEVLIRVNLEDVELTSEHVKDFMRMVENVRSVTVVEDSTVDKGGCIIESDFGEIDARISSQLSEIEEKILELVPIKSRGEK